MTITRNQRDDSDRGIDQEFMTTNMIMKKKIMLEDLMDVGMKIESHLSHVIQIGNISIYTN